MAADKNEIAKMNAVGASGAFWIELRAEAERASANEPIVHDAVQRAILDHASFGEALIYTLSDKLACSEMPFDFAKEIAAEAIADQPDIVEAAVADLRASRDRNPAYPDHVAPFLYYKGFQVLQWQRICHWLWMRDRKHLALLAHGRACDVFSIDIHPGARLGRGIFLDHGTGVVVGETAVIEDDVSMLHGVTLGGTGKQCGDRHPKVRRGVLISAGAKILGNIEIGEGAKIGAGSVVLTNVLPFTTVAGMPARIVARRDGNGDLPALSMDHNFPDWDISI